MLMSVKPFFARLWKALASIHLSLILCLLLAADAVWGYACIHRQTALFIPLNDMGLIPWTRTWGQSAPATSAWFFLLLILLALLALNTLACTLERLRQLWAVRTQFSLCRFLGKLGPHIMHLSVLLILLGYLASYTLAKTEHGVLLPGRSLDLPGNAGKLHFTAFAHEAYQGKRMPLFQGEVIRPKALLRLEAADGTVREAALGFNRPVRLGGWSVHLEEFAPKHSGGMGLKPRIDLKMRRDPGVRLYFAGILLFCLGLGLYLPERLVQEKHQETHKEPLQGETGRQK